MRVKHVHTSRKPVFLFYGYYVTYTYISVAHGDYFWIPLQSGKAPVISSKSECVRVVVRCRPMNEKETRDGHERYNLNW